MKSFIRFLFAFLLALTLLTSCNKEEKLKNQYIEACADENFDKARAVVLKLESVNSWEANEGMKYVNDKEIYHLLAKLSSDNNARILYLYNAYEEDQLPDMSDVVDVAISMGNENLAEKLIKAGVKPTEDNAKAAARNDMEGLVELMLDMNPLFITSQEIAIFGKERLGGTKMLDLIVKASNIDFESVISSSYLQEYIFANDKILMSLCNNLKKSLIDIQKSSPSIHSPGIVNWYDHYVENEASGERRKVRNFNDQLLQIFNNALLLKDKTIAMDAVKSMLPNIEIIEGSRGRKIHGYDVDGDHKLIYHNYDQINNLKKQLN